MAEPGEGGKVAGAAAGGLGVVGLALLRICEGAAPVADDLARVGLGDDLARVVRRHPDGLRVGPDLVYAQVLDTLCRAAHVACRVYVVPVGSAETAPAAWTSGSAPRDVEVLRFGG